MNDFVLEIGVENLPASYIEPAMAQLKGAMETLLETSRLDCDEVAVAGTMRRLVVTVLGLAERQSASVELVTGPPAAKAFDDAGKLTPAGEGFARSRGIPADKLELIKTPKGEYVGVRRSLPRRKTTAIMREELGAIVVGLRFPKSMKWEESGARFARPVRWLLALYGTTPIRFTFAGVSSGTKTWLRPWMKGESAVVRSAASYHKTIARLGIVLDPRKRRSEILRLAERAAARQGLSIVEDRELIDELCFMVENPRALAGEFPDSYLDLPADVITTAMRSHQRYIALTTAGGKLAPGVVTFTDGPVSRAADVRRGNERVLKARLADALFYWREDLKRGIDGLADELDRIVFIDGLGTIGEKSRRMDRLARAISRNIPSAEGIDDALISRASRLAKADLASEMIKDGKEFTKLQGVIGSHYARASGEDRQVVTAIREHYHPRTPSAPLPRGALGTVIGIADRIDSICGCFLAGFKPTGSQDPYALRRTANGLIRLIDRESAVRLDELITDAFAAYGESGVTDDDGSARADVIDFMKARAEGYLREHNVPYDVANAVVPVSWTRPGQALRRGQEIARLRGDIVFERLITGVKRVGNILPVEERILGEDWASIARAVIDGGELRPGVSYSRDSFEDEEERRLDAALREALPALESAEDGQRFREVLERLSGLADPIDQYFDGVLVNCEDRALRDNRIRFLSVVYALFGRYADFSRIVDEGAD